MKKIYYFVIAALAAVSCTNDEHQTTTVSGENTLRINASIGEGKSTRAEKLAWQENDQIGVFVCNSTIDKPYLNNAERYVNVSFRHTGGGFIAGDIYLDETPAEVFAYYPYSASSSTGTAVAIESSTQTDYLYGKAETPASISQKNVTVAMKHALSQVVFKIKKAPEYTEGPCVLSSLKIENNDATNTFRTAGTLNVATGEITGTSNMGVLTLIPGASLTLTSEYQSVSSICLPVTATSGQNIRAVFTIDGRNFKFAFPAATTWAPSTRNIYTLSVTNSGLEIGGGADGNTDGITIEPWGEASGNDISLVPIL